MWVPVSSYPWVAHRRGVIYDALHSFAHKDGYKLSDRIWRAEAMTRNKIDALLAHHIRAGTSAVDIAKELESFLKRERVGVRTRKPYGTWGSYDARRLARTEITAALGRGVIAAAEANPFVEKIGWYLSPSRTGDWDCNCEANADGSPYDVNNVPTYPDHPHCMCTLRPVVTKKPDEAVEDIRAWLHDEESVEDYSHLFSLTDLLSNLLSLWRAAGFAS